MTAITGARARRSLIGALLELMRGRGGRMAQLAIGIRENMMTIAAAVVVDVGGFAVLHSGGWFILGGSLLLLDFAISG